MDKLTKITARIKKWNREVFGNIDFRTNTFENEVANIERGLNGSGLDDVSKSRLSALKSQLNMWYNCKVCY